ncbi:uncharacterized protein METZ01_LOCUS180196 [marine metagenome]|uniref:Uncharacterized protein n=1 Tax=marine metagenome TaxID=408172 RepID=A0A382CNJ2_9ZZZZ|tara:strand:- start:393 stop:1157 length:765 start_codon:yes stop_codon:yes gene_type:complete
MSESAMYKMPPTDTSPFSLMLWAQFAIFGLFVLQGAIEDDWVWAIADGIAGLLLLLRVKNGRPVVVLLIPVLTIALGSGEGLGELPFMWIFYGALAYLPVLAYDEFEVELDSDKKRIGVLGLFTAMVVVMGMVFGPAWVLAEGSGGEFEDPECSAEPCEVYEITSDAYNIIAAGIVIQVAAIGMAWGMRNYLAGPLGFLGIFTSWYGMGDMGIGDDPAGADFAWMLAMLTFFTLVMYGALGREVAPNSDASEGE